MKKYLIVIEETATGYSAYSPDLPGCVSTGSTRAEVEANMREAITFHLDGLREEGEPVPEPILTPRMSNSRPDGESGSETTIL